MPAKQQQEVVPLGTVIHGYHLEKKLGSGGYGQVYLAWRDERPYALKFIHLESVGEWGWRELYLLLPLALPNVVRLLSHVQWPEDKPEYLVLVMEYVEGRPLYAWAREENPCAQEVAELFLKLVRALEGVHAAQVLHRDLKGSNVLVRTADREPVVVDFGAGVSGQVPRVTEGALAPGTPYYRSPDSVRFLTSDSREPGETYTYSATDELFALGVMLYVLLTDEYPFQGPNGLEVMWEIALREPQAPHELNCRVPRALGELCLRLLAKQPQDRPASARALGEELEAALRGVDASWKVPLCDGWDESSLTTQDEPELVGDHPDAWMRKWMRQRARRGRKPPAAEAPEPLRAAPVPEQTPELAPPAVGLGGAAVADEGRPPTPVGALAPVGTPPLAVSPSGRPLRQGALLRAVAVLGLLAALVLGGSRVRRLFPGQAAEPSSLRAMAPRLSAESSLERLDVDFLHEVAPPWKPPDAGEDTLSRRADIPMAVVPVTLNKGDTRVKKKVPGPVAEKKESGSTGAKVLIALAAANMACPGAQVRTEPAPQACPAGAVETMTGTLGLRLGRRGGLGVFPGWEQRKPISVQEGATSLVTQGPWGKLPDGTRLSGQLCFGEKRVYGRLTQAVTPQGDTFTVCMELYDAIWDRGVEIESDGGQAVKVHPFITFKAVERFE